MEIIASIIPNLCTQISHQTEYVRHLKKNVDALMEEASRLKALCEDTEREEREASRGGQKLTKQAHTWLDHARAILAEIDSIKLQFDRRRTFCNGCFLDLWSDYKLGKRAFEKLEPVRKNLIERSGIQLFAMSSPPRVIKMDVPTVGQSSAQRTMDEIWNVLHDKHTSVICIYGMGGVGKTTLMKAINKKLEATSEFHYVIWVTVSNVSKELILERVQQDIIARLRLRIKENASYQDRSTQLREYLSNKRYMLILDDLWNPINLSEIGIPTNKENGSKIAITTRLFEVCNDMKADAKIRVNTLTEAEAWDLFAANVGEEVAHQLDIKDIAKKVAMECGGLPLAIMVVAKAMKGEKKKELWEDALRAVRASVPEIRGMEPQVFRPLKLSYDDLSDEKVKMCFLYCSLFPEDYEIPVKRLIGLWIMEGFIDNNVDNLVDASNKGHRIIETLKRRCLLEEGIKKKNSVKMHDIIRDLALYIASSSCNEGPKFLIKAGFGKAPREETWREFDRISLMMNLTELPVKPACPNLISLFLTGNRRIITVPHSFFELMPALQVLDLSYTPIMSLSVSSSSLVNLRALILTGCYGLTKVPVLGQLKELQFLDIKSTGIRRLPEEMQNLVKLKKLNMHRTSVNWAKVENAITLGEVAKLKQLTILKITIVDFDCVEDDVFIQQLPKLEKFKISIGVISNSPNKIDCIYEAGAYMWW